MHVGERNNTVSEIMADNIKPAIALGISWLFSIYNLVMIVLEQPTGSKRMNTGPSVSKSPIR